MRIPSRYLLYAALVLAGGCSSKLSTGYEPNKLGASQSQRRTYYASPYSPESRDQGYGAAAPPGASQ
jgi:hypothetical protein